MSPAPFDFLRTAVDWESGIRREFDPRRIDAWQTELDRETLRRIETQADLERFMSRFDYRSSNATGVGWVATQPTNTKTTHRNRNESDPDMTTTTENQTMPPAWKKWIAENVLRVGWWHHVRGLDVTITLTCTNFRARNDFASFYKTYGPI